MEAHILSHTSHESIDEEGGVRLYVLQKQREEKKVKTLENTWLWVLAHEGLCSFYS